MDHRPHRVGAQVVDGIGNGVVHQLGMHHLSFLLILSAHLIAQLGVRIANQFLTLTDNAIQDTLGTAPKCFLL